MELDFDVPLAVDQQVLVLVAAVNVLPKLTTNERNELREDIYEV
jgi:hypothetical protein